MSFIDKVVPRTSILGKLLISFLTLSIFPLVILGYWANGNLEETGKSAKRNIEEMGRLNLGNAERLGERVIKDSVEALDAKSTEAIEVRTVDLANSIAAFLYERDDDLRALSTTNVSDSGYLKFYKSHNRHVVVPHHDPYNNLQDAGPVPKIVSTNPENLQSWRQRPPVKFQREKIPLYMEISFIDLDGNEKIRITSDGISHELKDVSFRNNTYCKAEDYFTHLKNLSDEEIYVSRVIGAHIPGWLKISDGMVTVKGESAYAGKENPQGQKFSGIIRWAMPVLQNGVRTGYCTMALDHTHVMQFTDHVVPTEQRFSAISDAGEGNYAWLWDHEDRCISHPRDFFIMGFDCNTGEEIPGWISEETYREFVQSGKSLNQFVKELPSFRKFTQTKKGARAQIESGRIALDCRTLDMAPQCQGWHEGSEDGGSGSFVILWSGLWKLTSYAAVPYFTGQYRRTERGFGYVTFGANVDDFHKAANVTKGYIQQTLKEQEKSIQEINLKTEKTFKEHEESNRKMLLSVGILSLVGVLAASVLISYSITRPIKDLTAGAMAMRRGDLNQRITVQSRDEIGELASSFNEMAANVAEVDRMKSEFVTIASHELRTPIHSMLLGVSGILGGYAGEINDEVKQDLEIVRTEIDRLMKLVNDLLDLSRIEARKIQLELTFVPVSYLVSRAVAQVSDLADRHHHTIENRLIDDETKVFVDSHRIVQVLVNLLGNSIKYSPDYGHIIVEGKATRNSFLIQVIDNGYGVPEWAQKKIFDKFFQADIIMSQKVGGSGLGLNISKLIVEDHGGLIECVSPVDQKKYPDLPLDNERKGAIINISLPLA